MPCLTAPRPPLRADEQNATVWHTNTMRKGLNVLSIYCRQNVHVQSFPNGLGPWMSLVKPETYPRQHLKHDTEHILSPATSFDYDEIPRKYPNSCLALHTRPTEPNLDPCFPTVGAISSQWSLSAYLLRDDLTSALLTSLRVCY